MVTKRELGWPYLYEIVFKSKTVKETRTLYNNKKVTSPGRYNKDKYICTQHQSVQTYEANIDRYEWRNRQQHNNSRFPYSTFNNRWADRSLRNRGPYTNTVDQMDLQKKQTHTEHFTQQEQNTCSPQANILWGQHHPNTNAKQRGHKKRKLQTNVPDECRCKTPQQNTRNPNSATY